VQLSHAICDLLVRAFSSMCPWRCCGRVVRWHRMSGEQLAVRLRQVALQEEAARARMQRLIQVQRDETATLEHEAEVARAADESAMKSA